MAEILCTDSVLCFVAPSWLLWIVAGLILNGTVHWKHLLPSMVRGVMEYGKLRHGESKSGLGYLLTVPKRCSDIHARVVCTIYAIICVAGGSLIFTYGVWSGTIPCSQSSPQSAYSIPIFPFPSLVPPSMP